MWGCGSVGRALASHVRGQGFESPHLHHVAASLLVRRVFCIKTRLHLIGCRSFFARVPGTGKKARSAHLFGCKRPHDGSLSLPPFCNSAPHGAIGIIFERFSHVGASKACSDFLCEYKKSVACAVAAPLSHVCPERVKRHARLTCSVVNALTTARCRYHLFAIPRLRRCSPLPLLCL